MNSRKSIYDIKSFYSKGAEHKAGYKGMRYLIRKSVQDEETSLEVCIWPEPFCFEKTDDSKKEFSYFDFTEEGLDEAYEWIVSKWESDYSEKA
ncbi:MAG: hypothetical protein K6G11_01985 [Lachnospiraceae bacterium]|nr:hypothetical protein [Lachnospiraceae bacterium]